MPHEKQSFLYFGFGAVVYPYAKIVNPGNVFIDDHAMISDFTFINAHKYIKFGKYAHLGPYSMIAGGGNVHIGDLSSLSGSCKVISGTDDIFGPNLISPAVPREHRNMLSKKVEIGDLCFIGSNAIIYPGVTIGEGAVVCPGTMVREDLMAWHIYDGAACECQGQRRFKDEIKRKAKELLEQIEPEA